MNKKIIKQVKQYKQKQNNLLKQKFNIDINIIEVFKKNHKPFIKLKNRKNLNNYLNNILTSLQENKKEYKLLPLIVKKRLKQLLFKFNNKKKHFLISYNSIKGFKFFFNEVHSKILTEYKKNLKKINKMFIIKKFFFKFFILRKVKKIYISCKVISQFFNKL